MNENSRSWRSDFRDWLLRNANVGDDGYYSPGSMAARTIVSAVPLGAGLVGATKIAGGMLAADYGPLGLAYAAGVVPTGGAAVGAAATGTGVGTGLVGAVSLADMLTPYSNDLTTEQAAADLYRVRHAGYLVPRTALRFRKYLTYDDLDGVEKGLHFEDRFPNGTGLGYRTRQGRSDVMEALAQGSSKPMANFGMGGGNIGERMEDTLGPDFRDISGVRKPGAPMDLVTRALETDEDRALRELLDREARDLYHERFFGTGAYDPSRIRTAFEAAAADAYRRKYGNRFIGRDPDGDPYAEEEFAPPDLMKDPNYYLSGKNVSPAMVDLYATARKKGMRSVPVFKVPDWFKKKFKWEVPDSLIFDVNAEEDLKVGKPLEFGPEPPAWWPDWLLPPASMTGESHGAKASHGAENKTEGPGYESRPGSGPGYEGRPGSGLKGLLPKKLKGADRDPGLDERPETIRHRAIDATNAANMAGDSDMNLYRQFYGDKTEGAVDTAKKARARLAGVLPWGEEFQAYKNHNLDGMPIVLPERSPWVNMMGSLSRGTRPVAHGDIYKYDEGLNKPFATSGYYSIGQMNAGGRAHATPARPGEDPVVWLPPEHGDLHDPVARHEIAHPGNIVANPLLKDETGRGIDWYLDNMETTGPGVFTPHGTRAFNYHWDNPNEFAAAYANVKRAVGKLGQTMPDDFDAFIQDKFGDMLKGQGTQTDIEKLSSRIDRRLDELGIPRVDAGDLIRQYIFIRELDPKGSIPGLRKIAEKYGADPDKTIKAFGTKDEREAVWQYMQDILSDKDFLHSILKSDRRGGGGNDSVHADAGGGEAGSETAVPETPVSEGAPTPPQGGPRIVINPTTFRNKKDALCVAFNEAFRIVMEDMQFDPVSEPTERQRKFFSDTAYANDENQLRRTILARICTFDTSVKDPTDEQLQEAVEFLESVLEAGVPRNEWEQSAVARIRDVVSKAVGAPRVEEEGPRPPEDDGTVRGDVGGGDVDAEEERDLERREAEQEARTGTWSAQGPAGGQGPATLQDVPTAPTVDYGQTTGGGKSTGVFISDSETGADMGLGLLGEFGRRRGRGDDPAAPQDPWELKNSLQPRTGRTADVFRPAGTPGAWSGKTDRGPGEKRPWGGYA